MAIAFLLSMNKKSPFLLSPCPPAPHRQLHKKKRGTDIQLLFVEVLRLPLNEEWSKTAHAYTRASYALLHSFRNFSGFNKQDEHNASLINMYGLVHRQTNGKDKKRKWNGKIYFAMNDNIFISSTLLQLHFLCCTKSAVKKLYPLQPQFHEPIIYRIAFFGMENKFLVD